MESTLLPRREAREGVALM
uniref:Uncharacterized protein n=1 Tax=Arundo donax TaxID=35708 RepID=A0A0A9F0Z1_ARUDO